MVDRCAYEYDLHISDGGTSHDIDGAVISWVLPNLGTADEVRRTFSVRVDDDLVSGTHIINDGYAVFWGEEQDTFLFSHTGEPVTTTVKEVGLIDSYKAVTPTLVEPGEGNILTYTIHVVNSSPLDLENVQVYDTFPWEVATYQRDATASAADELESDIVSLAWQGDVAAFAEEVITFTVLVDEDYRGPISNTAIITHPELLAPVEVDAVAYAVDEPVLEITKDAPASVKVGEAIDYVITVKNHGQQATNLVITDTIPANTTLLTDTISGSGEWIKAENLVRWDVTALHDRREPELPIQRQCDAGRHRRQRGLRRDLRRGRQRRRPGRYHAGRRGPALHLPTARRP